MYKEDLALNNLQGLIGHKTKKQTWNHIIDYNLLVLHRIT